MGPPAAWGAPGPLHPPGCTCRPGLPVWKALHACRAGKSVPVPEPGPPHPARAGGEPTKRLCSCPGTNGLEAAGIGCQPATPETPRVRPREGGQVEGWKDGRTDRGDAAIAGSGETRSCATRGCGTGSVSWGPPRAGCTVPAPGTCPSAPEMLAQPLGQSDRCWLPAGATEPWEQCHQVPAGLARTSWHCSQEMGSGKSGCCGWKQPPRGAGRGGGGIGAVSVRPHWWGPSSASLPRTPLPS